MSCIKYTIATPTPPLTVNFLASKKGGKLWEKGYQVEFPAC